MIVCNASDKGAYNSIMGGLYEGPNSAKRTNYMRGPTRREVYNKRLKAIAQSQITLPSVPSLPTTIKIIIEYSLNIIITIPIYSLISLFSFLS